MVVFLNGKFVAEERALVPVSDRGLLYGDGLFETLLVYGGVPFRWKEHMERLEQGLKLLRIKIPFSSKELRSHASHLMEMNSCGASQLLRITITRGSGPRGYSLKLAKSPMVLMTLHPLPADPASGWRLITSSFRVLADDPLTQSKTCSKVRSVLARAEAEDQGADEALLLNERGEIAEGAATNIFWIQNGIVSTPALSAGILPGVTRAAVIELCRHLKLRSEEAATTPKQLLAAAGVFVTVSTMGIVEAISLDGAELRRSPVVATLRDAYRDLVRRETKARA